ncbi:MAG: sensor histidine kinase [Syntrophobacteraceae bacterium]
MQIKVLLVDDEKEFLDLLAERLSTRGLSIAKASDGGGAMRHLEEHDTDVVILDVLMPGRDGISILREIRQTRPFIPIILLTGHGSIESAVEGMKAGAFDYVIKPIEISDLMGKISAAYEHKVRQEENVREAVTRDERNKQLTAERIEAEKLASVGELASGIAHEINNPIAVMVEKAGWIEDLLSDETLDLDEIRKSLRQISVQGGRCKEITHKLLSFSGKMDPVLREVQVNVLISNLLAEFEKRSKFGNIRVRTNLAPDIPSVIASPAELQQVFSNLINNAIDAIDPTGGVIEIGTRLEGEWVAVDFTDTGHGISEAAMTRIFEPFYTTRPVGKGTGLGLSICYGLVQRLGGKITVRSTLGSGTTFSVFLPRQRCDT